jgi:hypothetical protein
LTKSDHAKRQSLDPAAKARAAQEFARQKAEKDRALESARRNLFSHFRMWTVCPDARCKRAQACAGNVERCMNERWHPLVPAEIKSLLQKQFAYLGEGHAPRDAVRLAAEDMERHRQASARVDALYPQGARTPAAAEAPSPQPPSILRRAPPPQRGPRIRFP